MASTDNSKANSSIDTTKIVSKILAEDVITLSQARTQIANITGIRHDKSTLTRWIHRGVGGVKLEAVRLGGRDIFTSTQAITRFIEARTKAMYQGEKS